MWIGMTYLDASAAVKRLLKEERNENLEKYLEDPDHSANLFMTSFCVAETLAVLKRKFLRESKKEQNYKEAQEKYLTACAIFIGDLRGGIDRGSGYPYCSSRDIFES